MLSSALRCHCARSCWWRQDLTDNAWWTGDTPCQSSCTEGRVHHSAFKGGAKAGVQRTRSDTSSATTYTVCATQAVKTWPKYLQDYDQRLDKELSR